MQLDGSYEFVELSQADGILVSSARQKDTGKLVQFHLFPAEHSRDADQICHSIMDLPDAARAMIIKFGKDGTSTYFVTEPLPQGKDIKAWIAGLTAPAPPAVTAFAAGPADFARIYTAEEIRKLASRIRRPAPTAAVHAQIETLRPSARMDWEITLLLAAGLIAVAAIVISMAR